MLRIPKARVDLKAIERYFVGGHAARLTSTGERVLLALSSNTEEPEYDEQSQGSLAALSPLRAELTRPNGRGKNRAKTLFDIGTVTSMEARPKAGERPLGDP